MKKLYSHKYLQLILTFSVSFLLSFDSIGQTSLYTDAVSSGTIWHSDGAESTNPAVNHVNHSSTVINNAGSNAWEKTELFPDSYTIQTGDHLFISFYNPNNATSWQLQMSLSASGNNIALGTYTQDVNSVDGWFEKAIDLKDYVGEDLSKIIIYPSAGEAKSVFFDNMYIGTSSSHNFSYLYREVTSFGLWNETGGIEANPSLDATNYSANVLANDGASGWKQTQWFPNYVIQTGDKFHISYYNPNGAVSSQIRMDLSTTGNFTSLGDPAHDAASITGWVEQSIDLSAYVGETISKIQLYPSGGDAKKVYYDNVYFSSSSILSNYWVGTTSTDWLVNTNWQGNQMPTTTSSITIASTSNTPIITTDVTVTSLKLVGNLNITSGSLSVNGNIQNTMGKLTVNSGASLITMGASTIDDVIVKKNTRYADGKYSFVGSPVAQKNSITGADLGSTAYVYDETQAYSAQGGDRWVDASSIELKPGVGYAQAFQKELVFEGTPNDGSITVSNLSYTAGTANEQGWNLISNPYPAAIDVTKFLAANSSNIDNAIYLWDDGGSETGAASNNDYLSVNTIGSTSGNNGGAFNGYISSMQGFFVKLSSVGTSSVVFNEDMRATGNNADANFFRKVVVKPTNIKLSLQSSDGSYNELLIGLREDATVGIDRIYDASKFISNDQLQFYSYIGDSKYTIQGLPLVEGVSTTLGYDLGKAADLEISIKEMSGIENGMTFLLTDKITNEVYDLNETSSLNFSSVAGSDQNRFVLSYSASSAILSSNIDFRTPIYRFQEGTLTVNFSEKLSIVGYAVYDLSGKILNENQETQGLSELNIAIPHAGINIVKIVTEKGTFTKKFISK